MKIAEPVHIQNEDSAKFGLLLSPHSVKQNDSNFHFFVCRKGVALPKSHSTSFVPGVAAGQLLDNNENDVTEPDYRFSIGQLPSWAKHRVSFCFISQ